MSWGETEPEPAGAGGDGARHPAADDRWLGMSPKLSILVIGGVALLGIACMLAVVIVVIVLQRG